MRAEQEVAPVPDEAKAPPPLVPTTFDPERLSLGLIVGTFAVMLVLSWQKWADPLIDFGQARQMGLLGFALVLG